MDIAISKFERHNNWDQGGKNLNWNRKKNLIKRGKKNFEWGKLKSGKSRTERWNRKKLII